MKPSNMTKAVLVLTCLIMVSGCSAKNAKVVAQQRELEFVVKKLDAHPMTSVAEQLAFRAFADRELQIAQSPQPNWRIVEIEERLAAWFQDPHTNASALGATYRGARSLPVAFDWLSDGLVTLRLRDTPKDVRTGDRVLDISGVATLTVAQRLRALVGGDTIFRRHFAEGELPTQPTLSGLGLVGPGGNVTLRLERADGSMFTVDLALRSNANTLLKAERVAYADFDARYELPESELKRGHSGADWSWYVTRRYGFFQLTDCVYDAAYRKATNAFFQQVADEHSPVVVLDLQQNSGGYSNVIIPWLEHLPVRYKMSDKDLGAGNTVASALPLTSPIFTGQLYVLQSNGTFSSAMWLSEALTGPGLGVRVGSAVGEPTSGYGNPAEYRTPLLHVYFQVSTQWLPAFKRVAQPTLKAQIPLNLTVADVQHAANPVARWLATLP